MQPSTTPSASQSRPPCHLPPPPQPLLPTATSPPASRSPITSSSRYRKRRHKLHVAASAARAPMPQQPTAANAVDQPQCCRRRQAVVATIAMNSASLPQSPLPRAPAPLPPPTSPRAPRCRHRRELATHRIRPRGGGGGADPPLPAITILTGLWATASLPSPRFNRRLATLGLTRARPHNRRCHRLFPAASTHASPPPAAAPRQPHQIRPKRRGSGRGFPPPPALSAATTQRQTPPPPLRPAAKRRPAGSGRAGADPDGCHHRRPASSPGRPSTCWAKPCRRRPRGRAALPAPAQAAVRQRRIRDIV
uniref:Uncharacterized protein n=1 Tax=Oryza sativa subsp. japonica TaxID=39947 RepID=Q84Z22_ORYSJ|nr:hypothetical protein [Oryza sativa Japonica Group]